MEVFSFSGRANRMEYWLVGIGLTFLQVVIIMLLGTFGGMMLSLVLDPAHRDVAVGILSIAIVLGFFWPVTAVAVRRSHDRNMSGWWYGLFAFFSLALNAAIQSQSLRSVPATAQEVVITDILALFQIVVFLFFVVVLGFLPGTRGANRFGPAPNSRQENYRAPPV